MKELITPKKLKRGDTIAAITLSWGGASLFKDRYDYAKNFLKREFGLNVIETPNALQSEEWIYNNPEKRLDDLMWALDNKNVSGIISMIGGSDSVRLLQKIKTKHFEKIKNNPKIFLGMSDTTTVNFMFYKAGVKSYYGPSMLYGLAENGGMHSYGIDSMYKELFQDNHDNYIIPENREGWTLDKTSWKKEFEDQRRRLQPSTSWKYIQGSKITSGNLIGGCADVLEVLKGTKVWPKTTDFKNTILFLETSEDKPSPDLFKMWLRNYGSTGIFKKISGIIFARPGGEIKHNNPQYDALLENHLKTFAEYDKALIDVAKEYGRTDMPIVTHVDFGHTCPMLTLPFGSKIEINPQEKVLKMII